MGTRFQRWLRAKAEQPYDIFADLIKGILVFIVGYLAIFLSNHHMTPSMEQELVALAGLIICILGGIFWLKNYLTLIMVKIFLKPTPIDKE